MKPRVWQDTPITEKRKLKVGEQRLLVLHCPNGEPFFLPHEKLDLQSDAGEMGALKRAAVQVAVEEVGFRLPQQGQCALDPASGRQPSSRWPHCSLPFTSGASCLCLFIIITCVYRCVHVCVYACVCKFRGQR